MTEIKHEETVASAQPFLDAEKEQMEQLQQKSKELGETTTMNAEEAASAVSALAAAPTVQSPSTEVQEQLKDDWSHLTPKVQAQLKELEELKKKEQEELPEEQEEKEDWSHLPPEVQAQLKELEELKKKEQGEQEELPEEQEEDWSHLPLEVQEQLKELEEIKKKEQEEQKEKENDPNYIKFAKPYSFEGVEYKGIRMDFDEMTGADILEAEEEFIQTKTQTAAQTPLKELSKGYLSFFAARACAQPVDFILGLDGKSFAKVTRKAQAFLLAED